MITLKQELRKRGDDPVGFRIVDIPSDSNAGIKEEMGRFQLVLQLLTSLVIAVQELRKRGRGEDTNGFRIFDIPSNNTAGIKGR